MQWENIATTTIGVVVSVSTAWISMRRRNRSDRDNWNEQAERRVADWLEHRLGEDTMPPWPDIKSTMRHVLREFEPQSVRIEVEAFLDDLIHRIDSTPLLDPQRRVELRQRLAQIENEVEEGERYVFPVSGRTEPKSPSPKSLVFGSLAFFGSFLVTSAIAYIGMWIVPDEWRVAFVVFFGIVMLTFVAALWGILPKERND